MSAEPIREASSLNRYLVYGVTFIVCVTLLIVTLALYSTSFGRLRPVLFADADMLIIPSFYNDLANGVDITGWRVPPATYFFPDIVFYSLIRALTGSMFTALPLYGLVQFGLFIGGLVLLAKQSLPVRYRKTSFIIIALMTALFLRSHDFIHFADQLFLTAHHFGVLVVIPWALALVYKFILSDKLERNALMVLAALSILASFSDSFYVIQFAVPVSAALIFISLLGKIDIKRVLVIIVSIAVGCILGYYGFALLSSKDPALTTYAGRFPISEVVDGLRLMLKHFSKVKPVHMVVVGGYILICILVILQAIFDRVFSNKLLAHRTEKTFYALYYIGAGLVTGVALTVSGMYLDIHTFRYFLPTLILPAFLGIPFIVDMPKKLPQRIWLIGVVVVCVAVIALTVGNIDLQQIADNVFSEYYPDHVQCIDEHTSELGITYGIAQYWRARPITELSHADLKVVQVLHNLTPFYWCNNKYWYDMQPEFIVIDTTYPDAFEKRLDETELVNRLGEPDTSFVCDNYTVLVYTREDSPLRNIFDGYFD